MEAYKLVIHNPNKKEKRLVVFVGTVPLSIRVELDKLSEDPTRESKLLAKHYGKSWKRVLGINIVNKIGGDDELDVEQFEALLSIPTEKPEQHIFEGKTSTIEFASIQIFEFDKVSELKDKIFAATGIPPYRQHIWSGADVLSYKIIAEIPVTLNIYNHIELASKVDDVAVNMQWYDIAKSVKIESYDDFRIMKDYGYTLEMVDLDNLLPRRGYKETELIYYGFVRMFFPMIANYDVFQAWLRDNLSDYPLLQTERAQLKQKIGLEESILNQLWDVPQKFQHQILGAITSSILTFLGATKISIRNLFDKIYLNKMVPQCKVHLLMEGRSVEFHKQIDNSPPITEKIPTNSIIFKVRAGDETSESFNVTILSNSTIIVHGKWLEDYYFGFDEIFDVVETATRQLFAEINAMKEFVFGPSSAQLPAILKTDVRFSEIDICLFWKRPFSSSEFTTLGDVLREFSQGGIIEPTDASYVEFTFRKGMFQFDPRRIEKMTVTSNYYEHLTNGIIAQKWHTLFGKMRHMSVQKRFSDIKIMIIGVREQEYKYFHMIVSLMLWITNERLQMTKTSSTSSKITGDINEALQARQRKALSELKERDPELYSSKRSDVKIPYSKICQKPFQPLILGEHELARLKPDQKKRVIKYFNFTTHNEAFYYCPTKKYPWVKFLTHRHPKGYCIPCCKKTQQDDGIKADIHTKCLQDHIYVEEKKTSTEGSRYITSYGKSIDAGRLSHLPEGGLTKLLVGTVKLQQRSIARCAKASSANFYVIGMPQHCVSRQNVGMMFCIADALGMPHNEFLERLGVAASKTPQKLKRTPISGVGAYIVDTIQEMRLDTDWNDLFVELVFLYFDLYVMVLEDSGDGKLSMRIPSEITDMTRLIPPGFRTLIVIHNFQIKTYYPVYEINTDEYFSLGVVKQKTFASDSPIIHKFLKIVERSLQVSLVGGVAVYERFNLELADKFFTISELFINHVGNAYYFTTKEGAILPVHESSIKGQLMKLNVNPPPQSSYRKVASALKQYNAWAANVSKQAKAYGQHVYPILKPEVLLLVKGRPIGFVSNGLNFYCSGMPMLNIKKREILYNPHELNTALHVKEAPVEDWRILNIKTVTRDVYLYRMFIIQVYYYFMRKKNEVARRKLKRLIAKTDFSGSLDEFYEALEEIGDRRTIFELTQTLGDKSKLLQAIDGGHFSFDEVELNKLKAMKQDDIPDELRRRLKPLFRISDDPSEEVSNILIPNKLTLTKDEFECFIEHLAYMFSSPTLQNNIFLWITTDNTINRIDFERHPGEILY